MRDEAERILEDARKALDEAGQQAVVALGGLEGSKTESEGDWFGASGDLHGPKFNWKFFERTFGLEEKGEKGSPFELSLGSAEGEAHVGKGKASGRTTTATSRSTPTARSPCSAPRGRPRPRSTARA